METFPTSPLLQTLITTNNYSPNTKPFVPLTNEIKHLHNFKELFPSFFSSMESLDTNFSFYYNTQSQSSSFNSSLRKYIKNQIPLYTKEITTYIPIYWNSLKLPVKVHTIIFFNFAFQNISSSSVFSNNDKNILYWTILFHDIGKFQKMNPFYNESFNKETVDKTHPFKSSVIFIEEMLRHQMFEFKDDKLKNEFELKFNEFKNVIFKSFVYENSKSSGKMKGNISFQYIENIKEFLMYVKNTINNNTWLYDVIVLIMFHQSLPNNDHHMNKPLLPKEYIPIFFDLRLIELMRVIMVYDSSSYSLTTKDNWVTEINKHIDQVRLLFQ